MTKEEALKRVKGYLTDYLPIEDSGELDEIMEALKQEPCEDAISRQAVLDIAKSSRSNWIDNSVLFKRVNELPSVNPQPKMGHWLPYAKIDGKRGR